MSDDSSQQPNKVDWSQIESRMRSKEGGPDGSDLVPNVVGRMELAPTELAAPTELSVTLPDTDQYRGILFQYQKGKIDRKSALKAVQVGYDSQLDALRYQLKQAVNVSNARADRIAEEFLAKLNSEHLAILRQFNLKDLDARSAARIEVQDIIAAKLREVQSKDWPQPLKDSTIDDLIDLGKRVCAKMLKELGA